MVESVITLVVRENIDKDDFEEIVSVSVVCAVTAIDCVVSTIYKITNKY